MPESSVAAATGSSSNWMGVLGEKALDMVLAPLPSWAGLHPHFVLGKPVVWAIGTLPMRWPGEPLSTNISGVTQEEGSGGSWEEPPDAPVLLMTQDPGIADFSSLPHIPA